MELRMNRTLCARVAGAVLLAGVAVGGCLHPAGEAGPHRADSYLFCFWNVENLFDDREDEHTNPADREFDRWFARDARALHLKLDHLSDALVHLNEGRGPDILAVAEVESVRAGTLLRDALNARLRDPALYYRHVLMKDLSAGRHIAPAILTRLPVEGDRTRLHGRRQRILEGHLRVNGHDLVVLASHWTSRLTDKEGKNRADYADQLYGTFRAMHHVDPHIDLLICGDFNDPPDAPSVTRHLHAIGDIERVRLGGQPPLLLDLFSGKDPLQFGTHHFGREWMTFDQIVVSPGMLDAAGWSCDPDSARTVNTLVRPGDRQRRPWRFGGERDQFARGYSDHFPVTARLYVEAP
jgi:endonuclease/exonuclease/phosphatase family metal-dependent hydrolase